MKYNIEQKLETTVRTLHEWETIKSIFPLNVSFLNVDGPSNNIPNKNKNFKPFKFPYLIYETHKYIWFKFSFDIDKHDKNIEPCLYIDTFINGAANFNRPQGILYLNGNAYQGVDINHNVIKLPKEGRYDCYLLLYTHDFSFSFPLYISLKYIDKRIRDLYYDFLVPLESIKCLLKNDKRYISSLTILDNAMNLIDFRDKHSKEFYSSIVKAKEYLYKNFYNNKNICGLEKYTINHVAHSHIDVAWLWDLAQTRQKIQRTMLTTMRLFNDYPNYLYMHSTPQLFNFLKEDNPSLFNKIKKMHKDKRFELDGAMWLEADCNLTSGESLARQLLYGYKFFKEEFNTTSNYLFLPDVFGYSAQLPQLLKECNISRFVTAKIGWNDTNRFPHDTFMWEGIDGSKVFTYLISTCDADIRHGIKDTTYTIYNAEMKANQLLGTYNRYQDKNINNKIISIFGYGDGGGGPTSSMLEKEKRFEYGMPGLGKSKLTTLKNALDEVENNFNKYKGAKPTISGELYLEFHRGTYTSVPEIKYNVRKAEFALQNTEELNSLTNILLNNKYDSKDIEKNWKTLLLNEFHDIVPGSSIKKVYDDSRDQFKSLFKYTDFSINNSINLISKNIDTNGGLLVYNSNGFNSDGLIEYNNQIYCVSNIPSFGYKVIKPCLSKNVVKVKDRVIENRFFIVKLGLDGSIISLFDKTNKKEIVKKGTSINQLVAYENMPYEYDNWELTPYHFEKSYLVNNKNAKLEIVNKGDAKGYKVTTRYFNSTIVQTILLYSDIDRIDVYNEVVWKEKRHVLKALFPFDNDVNKACYDIQFGNIYRTTRPKNSWDEAKFESVGQKFVDMSNKDYGIAIINDCKYGYGAKDNTLSLTLLTSGSFPFDGSSNIIPPFVYSIYPHKNDLTKSKVIENAYLVNRPFIFTKVNKNKGKLKDAFSLINIDQKGVYLETIKKAEDNNGFIIRLYEAYNRSTNINIRFGVNVKEAYLTNLLEENVSKLKVVRNTISTKITPFKIMTIRVKLK